MRHSGGDLAALVLTMLLERKVDGDVRDEKGLTPLMRAAKADRVDAVEALVNIADVELLATDARGQTPLHMAARVGSVRTLRALLKCGHDVRCSDRDGNQPIHAACRGGDVATSVQETPRKPGVFRLWRPVSRSIWVRFGSFLDR